MALQVLDENQIVRTIPEVSEVGARIDEKVQANMPEDGADGKDGLSIWETTTNTTTGTTSIAISTLNKVAGRSVQVGDYIIGNATYSYLYLVTAVNSTTVTVTYRRTLRGATGSGGGVTVDTELSSTSENPVQNKVINAALTDGTVTKVGTTTVGSASKPIYLNNGVPTAGAYTLAAASMKSVSDSSSASALSSTDTNVPTVRDIYYGLPSINGDHTYTSSKTIYAPENGGTAGYYLKSNGTSKAPTWVAFPGAYNLSSSQPWLSASASGNYSGYVRLPYSSSYDFIINFGLTKENTQQTFKASLDTLLYAYTSFASTSDNLTTRGNITSLSKYGITLGNNANVWIRWFVCGLLAK